MIFLATWLIYRTFALITPRLRRHTPCVVTKVKRRTVSFFTLSSDDGFSSAIRQKYLFVKVGFSRLVCLVPVRTYLREYPYELVKSPRLFSGALVWYCVGCHVDVESKQ